MTTKVLTENQINGMKENGVTVIFNGCEVEKPQRTKIYLPQHG